MSETSTIDQGISPQVVDQPTAQIVELQAQEPSEVAESAESAGQNVLTMFNQLTTEQAVDTFKKSLLDELDDPQMQHVQRLREQIATLNERMKTESSTDFMKTEATIQGIEKDMYRMFGHAKNRYEDIKKMLWEIDASDAVSVIGDGAREMATQLLQQDAMYKSLDGTQRFIYSEHLPHNPEKGNKVRIHIKLDEEPIQIPVSSIVSPAEMESWDGRRGSDISAKKIKDYSEKESEITPIKDGVFAYILPDGRIFFESQNAHRVAAAVKKGQQFIGVQGPIILTKLDYIPTALM